jgi:tRNA(Ile)-lysidine synthase
MKNLLTEFQKSIQNLGLTQKDRVLLAVSGGLDSVVLTSCAVMAGLDFTIAHVNFQLREAESDRDENFVRLLALDLKKPFLLQKFDTAEYAASTKCSIQTAARNLRYQWFKTLVGNDPALFQFVLTAHHLDDNIETMLMHFFRGTGIAGLTGIPDRNDRILRPLLSFPKSELKEFAVAQNLDWVEDSSNASDDYTRNYFRNHLIPSLTSIFPEVLQNMEKNLFRFSETSLLYQQAIAWHKKKLVKPAGQEMHLPILLLKKTVPLQTVLYEIIKDYHFTSAQVKEVIRLMESSNGKYISSISHRIIKNRRWLIIAPLQDIQLSHIIIDQKDSSVQFPGGRLYLKDMVARGPEFVSASPSVACLDAEIIQFPLILRKWKTGDYFYPLGMRKKKKLARFFIDQKISKPAKEKSWVLLMDSQIIWVVGQRIDNRFAVRKSTKNILEITLENMPA